MRTLPRSKKSRHVSPATFRIVPRCPFCWFSRFSFYTCVDDNGAYVTVKCGRCEAEGPHVRRLHCETHRDVTDDMRTDAVDGWNSIWDHVAGPPATILIDADGKEISRPPSRRRRLAKAKAPVVRAPAPPAEHQIHTVTPPKATNGHNGHHTSGSVR